VPAPQVVDAGSQDWAQESGYRADVARGWVERSGGVGLSRFLWLPHVTNLKLQRLLEENLLLLSSVVVMKLLFCFHKRADKD
jgi:hypothetical protein